MVSSSWRRELKKEEKSRRCEGRDGGEAVREMLCSSVRVIRGVLERLREDDWREYTFVAGHCGGC